MYWSAGIGPNEAEPGVCIAIAEKWKENIFQYIEVIPSRAQYLALKINEVHYGFLNLYAPNQVAERTLLGTVVV